MVKRATGLLILVCILVTGIFTASASSDPLVFFEEPEQTIFVGKTLSVKPQFKNAKAKATLLFTSSDESVASVTKAGVVKGVSAGEATIVCTATTSEGTHEASYDIVVIKAVTSIKLGRALSLATGTTYTLQAEIAPSDATNPVLQWTSSKDSVVSVDANGNIAAHANGTATITATSTDGSKRKASVSVTVKNYDVIIRSKEGAKVTYSTGSGMFGISYDSKKGIVDSSSGDGDTVILTPIEAGTDTFTISVTNYLTRGTKRFNYSVYITPNALNFDDDSSAFAADKPIMVAGLTAMYDLAYQRKGQEYSLYLLIDTDSKLVKNFGTSDKGVLVGKYKGDLKKEADVHYIGGNMHDYLRFSTEDSTNTLIMKDMDGFEWEWLQVDVASAVEILSQPGYSEITSY